MESDTTGKEASFHQSPGRHTNNAGESPLPVDTPDDSASIKDYALQAFLGEGSTAHVYLATHSPSGDSVAIKVIDKLLVRQAHMQHKVQREILIHTPLRHRHVVRVKRTFEDTRNHYLVLEYCARGSVASLLRALRERGATLDESTAKAVFRQTAQGVAYLHSHGIIHRDLKLSNLLLTRDGDVKISDFGLATFISEEHATVCGTPNFIAPEVLTAAEAESSYDETVDIWSLGCILYTLLLGKPPFEGDKVSDTLANVSNAGRQPLQFPRGFSATSGDLIKRMLNVDPSARPTMAQILNHQWLRLLSPTRTDPSSDESEGPTYQPRRFVNDSQPKPKPSVRAKSATTRRRRPLGDKQRRPLSASYRRPVEYESDESSNADLSDAASYSSLDLHALNLSSSSEGEDESSGDVDNGQPDDAETAPAGGALDHTNAPALKPILHEEKARERLVRHNGGDSEVTDSKLTGEVLFLSLRIEVTDFALLDIAPDATREIVWDCWETVDIRQLTRFTMQCNGWELVYIPAQGLLQGTTRQGSPLAYQCSPLTPSPSIGATTSSSTEDDAIQLMRLCHCLASRSLQLRRAAMAIDVEKLPIVHYDKLPAGILDSLRRESVRTTVSRELGHISAPRAAPDVTTSGRNSVRCTIPGVGAGEFNDQGRLTINFFGGASLEMNANGSTIRYRRSPSALEDEFDLSSTPFLPTEVKKYFEHVPAFVRELKTP